MKHFILLFVLINLNVFAQNDSTKFRYWFNTSLGLNTSSTYAFGFNYNFSTWDFYSQVGYQTVYRYMGPFDNDYNFMEFPLKSINIGIGDVIAEDYYFAAFMIGPAYTWGTKNVKNSVKIQDIYQVIYMDKEEKFNTIGLVFNAQIFFTFVKEIGVGLELYGNINNVRSLAEIKLSLHFNNGTF
ncbi:MAG: hypothetical protein V1773_10695 [bacterium]